MSASASASEGKRRFRLAIVGARGFNDKEKFDALMTSALKETHMEMDDIQEVISGGAVGVDTLARKWAEENSIPVTEIKPDYNACASASASMRRAPLDRNTKIVKMSDVVFAFPSKESRGTWDTVRKAERAELKVYVCKCDQD